MATELSVEGFENHVQGHFLKVFYITNLNGSPLFSTTKLRLFDPN